MHPVCQTDKNPSLPSRDSQWGSPSIDEQANNDRLTEVMEAIRNVRHSKPTAEVSERWPTGHTQLMTPFYMVYQLMDYDIYVLAVAESVSQEAQDGLHRALEPAMTLSFRFSCLCLLCAEITGMCQHSWLAKIDISTLKLV